MRRALLLLLVVCAFTVGCEDRSAPVTTPQQARSPTEATTTNANRVIGSILHRLLKRLAANPDEDVLEADIGTDGWLELKTQELEQVHAKRGWAASVDGVPVCVSDGGTLGSFAIGVKDGFIPDQCRKQCGEFLTLVSHGVVDEDGQSTELLVASMNGEKIGLVILNWGTTPNVRGVGSLVYITRATAEKGGVWKVGY